MLTFNELINICVEGGDMQAATGLLKAMLHRGLRPDATTYTTLIKGYGLKVGPFSGSLPPTRLSLNSTRLFFVYVYVCVAARPFHTHTPQASNCLSVSPRERDFNPGKSSYRRSSKNFVLLLPTAYVYYPHVLLSLPPQTAFLVFYIYFLIFSSTNTRRGGICI